MTSATRAGIARRAFVGQGEGALGSRDGFRYQLVTVSSPFNGIEASSDCGSLLLHIVTLGISVGICQIIAGTMWTEIYPRSAFMRSPGTLVSGVERHIKKKARLPRAFSFRCRGAALEAAQ